MKCAHAAFTSALGNRAEAASRLRRAGEEGEHILSVPGRSYQVGAGVYDDELTIEDLERLARQ